MALPRFPVLNCFSRLRDPRKSRREKKHMLLDIIAIAICAVIAGSDNWQQVHAFTQARENWLRTFIGLPNGVPSHDTFERVFEMLSPQSVQRCFLRWIESVIERSDEPHFAIDGKTLRGSRNRRKGQRPLHLVSVWDTNAGLSLGQQAVAEKSNEITAIPILLKLVVVDGAWVSIDAMGCQKKIAALIVEGGGNYALTVKRNQSHLAEDLTSAFAAADERNFQGLSCSQYMTYDTGHGRVEKRDYHVIMNPENIRHHKEWKNLAVIGRCISERTCSGKTAREEHYFIGSKDAEAQRYGTILRNHWRIENSLHWQLDMTFNEDSSRIRNVNTAENFATLRKLALCLLKRHPAKDSIAVKRYRATMSESFLEEVIVYE